MKKFKLVSILFLVFAMVLSGCGKTETADTTEAVTQAGETTTAAPAEEIELTVWESTGGPDSFIQQAAEAYKAVKPNVTIKFMNVELGDSAGQIALDGPAGVGADLFAAPHDKLGELVTGGHILPTVAPETVAETALGSTVTALTYDGTMYGYPVSAETYALFYNKALIAEDQVPKTWDALKTFSKSFNDANAGKHGFIMDVANGYYTIIFTTNNDNRLFGASGTDGENTNINSEEAIKGMETFKSLREVLDFPAADLNTAYADGAFSSGNAAMYITGLWNVENFRSAGIDFGVAPLPSLTEGGDPVSSFSGTRSMFVSAYSNYPEEAAEFAAFLMTEEMQALRFELTGALPAIEMAVDSPYIEGFLTQLNFAFPMPSIPEMSFYWDAMNAASANIWDGGDIATELNAVDAAMKQ